MRVCRSLESTSSIHSFICRASAAASSSGTGGASTSSSGGVAAATAAAACKAAAHRLQARRRVWGESLDRSEANRIDSFYNTTVETYAQQPITALSLQRLLESGRSAALDGSYVMRNAQEVRVRCVFVMRVRLVHVCGRCVCTVASMHAHVAILLSPPHTTHLPPPLRQVQRELPRRLARRLFDLQLLPHIVVTNPHVTRVYHAYYHAFEVLRQLPPVRCLQAQLHCPPCQQSCMCHGCA
jgi:hypothetical protein